MGHQTGPASGFFPSWNDDRAEASPALELLHKSGSGFNCLYRSRAGGRNRLYKVLSERYRGDMLYESLLRKEFEIGYSLTHPGICSYYSYTTLPGLGNAIEMEWIDGSTLCEWLESQPSSKERRRVLDELLDSLAYMHRKQVIHRDLKPENIMITNSGQSVKIIDFGFSDSDAHAFNKGPAGTREYASPELIEGENIDQRSDIWSLGKIIPLLLPHSRSIVRKCLADKPDDRYPNVAALQKAIAVRRRAWLGPALILVVAAAVLAVWFRPFGKADVDALVQEAEEIISATISLTE